jgi:hypothetical protein
MVIIIIIIIIIIIGILITMGLTASKPWVP